MTYKSYAGIGSRETPREFLILMTNVAKYLDEQGFVLRSGGANGADLAFESGSQHKEVFLPWKGFNNNNSIYHSPKPETFEIAERFHPAWYKLSQGAMKLQARNCHQVLGWELNSPVDFVLCWTLDGLGRGGTGQAIRLAIDKKIPVFDMGRYSTPDICREYLWSFFQEIFKKDLK